MVTLHLESSARADEETSTATGSISIEGRMARTVCLSGALGNCFRAARAQGAGADGGRQAAAPTCRIS